jgi:hypothetical protein
MNGINPQTGKRLGKFLWLESKEEQSEYLAQLREKIESGFYTSESVLSSLVDEIAPTLSDAVDVEAVA